MFSPTEIRNYIDNLSIELGFHQVGYVHADQLSVFTPLIIGTEKWLSRGYHGEMDYLKRHFPLKSNIQQYYTPIKTVVVLLTSYYTSQFTRTNEEFGSSSIRISRHAWGKDYHKVLKAAMNKLSTAVEQFIGAEKPFPTTVDSSPVMEKGWAFLAGLGFYGKNSLIINPDLGSYFFISTMLLDFELTELLPEAEHRWSFSGCGNCQLCMTACPTQAIIEPGVIDARRCVAYLTIEHKDQIPDNLRLAVGNWIYGCDVCQDVCPYNQHLSPVANSEFRPYPAFECLELGQPTDLKQILTKEEWENSPLSRLKDHQLARNIRIALSNSSLL
jgi:epoxyqueuosine reductase